jgi:hypothetical protein
MVVDMILLHISDNDDVEEVQALFALIDQIRLNKIK